VLKISIDNPIILQDLTLKSASGWNTDGLFDELEQALVAVLKKYHEKFLKKR